MSLVEHYDKFGIRTFSNLKRNLLIEISDYFTIVIYLNFSDIICSIIFYRYRGSFSIIRNGIRLFLRGRYTTL